MAVWSLSCDENCADTVLRGRANRPRCFAFAITNAVVVVVVPVPMLDFGPVGRFLASSGSWHQQWDLSLSLAFSYSRRQYKVAVACVTKNRPMISSSSSSSMLSPLSAVRESRKSHAAVSAKPTSRTNSRARSYWRPRQTHTGRPPRRPLTPGCHLYLRRRSYHRERSRRASRPILRRRRHWRSEK